MQSRIDGFTTLGAIETDTISSMSTVKLQLFDADQLLETWQSDTPINVGRQDPSQDEPSAGPYTSRRYGTRAVIASIFSREVPRYFFSIETGRSGQTKIICQHAQVEVAIKDGPLLGQMQSYVVHAATTILLGGDRKLTITPLGRSTPKSEEYRSLNSMPLDPMAVSMASIAQADIGHETQIGDAADSDAAAAPEILQLLQHVLPVIRESVTSDSFFKAAAYSAIRIAGLNRAVVNLFEGGAGKLRAEVYEDSPNDENGSALRNRAPSISESMIESVRENCVTKIHDSGSLTGNEGASLQNLFQAVAAPILDRHRRVIGVLYGDRWISGALRPFTDIEAKLVEILASAIAAGMARQSEERQKSSMEVYFSDVVAKHIVHDATLLEPKEENVSVMFCDVRKFSSISRSLGPKRTVEWMQEMFTVLSECVNETEGVVINYIGDELIAMWGAPDAQPDHAARAMRSAKRMLSVVQEMAVRWESELCEPLRVGIGINSGLAAVGNTGSTVRFQYGVFGNVVNVASRLQNATKQFGVDCLVSDATVKECGENEDRMRRIATISVVGIKDDINVHQLVAEPSDDWIELCNRYESALTDYHEMQFADATQKLGAVLHNYPNDEPSMRLLGLSVEQLRKPSQHFTPTDSLTVK